MKLKLAVLFSCCLLLTLALPVMAQDPTGPSLTGTTWEWVNTVTPVEEITASDPSRYQIVFMEDGSVAVTLDCNRGFGSYTVDGESIQIMIVGSTMAFCGEESQADTFIQQLSNAAVFFFQDGNLFVDQAMDSGTMQFRPIAAALTDVEWQWTGTTSATGEETASTDPTRFMLNFHDDGTFGFMADCNVGGGTYTSADDGSLTVTFGMSTLAFCGDESQETLFKDQAGTAASFALGDGTLDVTLADGSVMHFIAAGTAPAPEASLLVGTTWQWIDLQMANVSEAVLPPESYTLTFNGDGTANLVADCNVGSAAYTADAGSITITPGALTMAMCPEESRSNQYLELLGQVTTYNITAEGWLELFTTDGFRLTFQPAPVAEPSLTGTTWQWVQTVTPEETVVAVDPARYTVTFNDDGTYAMVVDCNTGSGSFTVDGSTLQIGPGMLTAMGCPEDTQDAVFLTALNNAAVFFFQDGHLFIDQAMDSGTLEFQPAPAAAPVITDTVWQWVQTVTPTETVVAADPARYTVTFNGDGTYSAQFDCNSGSGTFTMDGSSLSVGMAATTMMACPEDSQANDFSLQLMNAAVFFVQDGHLFIDLAMDGGTMEFQPLS